MSTPPQSSTPPASRHSTLISLLVATAFFMEILDGTAIATALPEMAKSFNSNPVDLSMGMTAYLLTLAVFIPVSGWVADRMGPRTVFATAIAWFTLASVLCGSTNGLWQFTVARVLQGIGGAMMVPVGRLVVLRSTEKKDLMRAMSYLVWPALTAPILGPPVGGFITTYSSWRFIFFLNVPLGIIGFLLALRWISNEREKGDRRFDWLGFALAGTSCTAFMYGLELLGRQETDWTMASAALGYSLIVGFWAARHLQRVEHPLVELSCLKTHTFAISIWGGSLFRIAINATPFLLPLMFQVAFGMNAFRSGLMVLALFAGNFSMKSITTPILRRFGFRTILVINGMISTLLVAVCGFLTPETPMPAIIAVLFLHGLSRSMQFTAVNTLSFVDIPKSLMSSATSFSAVAQQMSMGMGVAVAAVSLRLIEWARGNQSGTPQLMDFHVAFWIAAMFALIAAFDCLSLDPRAGAEVSGHAAARA
ncbi:MAG: MFS transporter [Bryobacteraceae bacterium]